MLVDPLEVDGVLWIHPEKGEGLSVHGSHAGLHVLLQKIEELIGGEYLLVALELLGELADLTIEKGLGEGIFLWDAETPLSILFGIECRLKAGEIFIAEAIKAHLGVVGIHHLNRITEHDNDLHLRIESMNLVGGILGVEIPNRGLTDRRLRRLRKKGQVLWLGETRSLCELQIAAKVVHILSWR